MVPYKAITTERGTFNLLTLAAGHAVWYRSRSLPTIADVNAFRSGVVCWILVCLAYINVAQLSLEQSSYEQMELLDFFCFFQRTLTQGIQWAQLHGKWQYIKLKQTVPWDLWKILEVVSIAEKLSLGFILSEVKWRILCRTIVVMSLIKRAASLYFFWQFPSVVLAQLQDADCTKGMCSHGCPAPAQSFNYLGWNAQLPGPHFHSLSGQDGAPSGLGRPGQEAAEGQESRRSCVAHTWGNQHKARVYPSRFDWEARWVARSVSIHQRPVPHHVHLQALDYQTIRWFQHSGGEQQIL